MSCSKCLLVAFNCFLFIVGLVPLAIGCIAIANKEWIDLIVNKALAEIPGGDQFTKAIDFSALLQSAALYIIILGAVMVVLGFVGFCGAACSVRWLLGLYITIVLILILAEIGIIILAIFYPNLIESEAQKLMYKSLKEFKKEAELSQKLRDYISGPNGFVLPPSDAMSLTWHVMQTMIGCCGVYNWTDYNNTDIDWDNKTTNGVPLSCCKLNKTTNMIIQLSEVKDVDQCLSPNLNPIYINDANCFKTIRDEVFMARYIVIGVFGGIALFEILMIICAACICNEEGKNRVSSI